MTDREVISSLPVIDVIHFILSRVLFLHSLFTLKGYVTVYLFLWVMKKAETVNTSFLSADVFCLFHPFVKCNRNESDWIFFSFFLCCSFTNLIKYFLVSLYVIKAAKGFGQLSQARSYSTSAVSSLSASHGDHSNSGSIFRMNNLRHSSSLGIQMNASPSMSSSSSPSSPTSLYQGSLFILVVTAASIIIIVACTIAYAYVKLEERKVSLMQAGYRAGVLSASPSRNFQFLPGTPSSSGDSPSAEDACLRYPNTTYRPLLARPPIPSVLWAQHQGPIEEDNESDAASSSNPYSTLPFRKMHSFVPRNHLHHHDNGSSRIDVPLSSQSCSSYHPHSSRQDNDQINGNINTEPKESHGNHNINIHVNHCPAE